LGLTSLFFAQLRYVEDITTIVVPAGRCYAAAMNSSMPNDATATTQSTTVAVPTVDVVEMRQAYRLPRVRKDASDHRERWLSIMATLYDQAPAVVDELAIRQSLRALADATVRARASDLECFARFCQASGLQGLPAAPAAIVAYADALAEAGQKVTSIKRKLSSVSIAHTLLGLENPCQNIAVHHALRAVRKERGVAQRQALAVRLGEADDLPATITLSALLAACGDDPRELRDAALLSVAYDGGLRASEVIAATVEDIEAQADGSGILHLRRSKTDQAGEGAYVYLSPDTMQRIGRWLSVSTIASGTLFRAIYRRVSTVRKGQPARLDARATGGGKFIIFERPAQPTVRKVSFAVPRETTVGEAQLSTQGLAKIYRKAARRAAERGYIDLSGSSLKAAVDAFSTHGFRVGLTQDLFAEQFDVGQIQLAMRWKSATTALSYARKLNTSSNAAAKFLKLRRS
jgi:integrase